jgi:hypothetical protein
MAQAIAKQALAGAPPEFFLATACCQWPPSEPRTQAIRAAALASVDWPRALRIIERHRLWGLAQDGVARAEVPLPPETAQELRSKSLSLSLRNLAIAAEVLRLQSRFDDAGIPINFVKGSSLALLAYGNLSLRYSMDIDILVAPERVAAATLILETAGYTLIESLRSLTPAQFDLLKRYRKDWGFHSKERNIFVELHWKLSYNSLLLGNIGPNSAVQAVRVAQSQIHTFRFEELFIYLCAHGARHGWEQLNWLADVAALLAARGDRDIEALYRAAQKAGAGRCMGQAMLLGERLLGLELPASLGRELRQCTILALLEALALKVMLNGGAEIEARLSFGRYYVLFSIFFLGESWRYVLYELPQHLVSGEDLVALKLPTWLCWFYPIFRLPMWIWRRLMYVLRQHP